jgi:GDP-mannose transporter
MKSMSVSVGGEQGQQPGHHHNNDEEAGLLGNGAGGPDGNGAAALSPGRGAGDGNPNAAAPSPKPSILSAPTIGGIPTVLVAGMCYCAASGSMVLLNKHALNPKSFGFTAPNALLAFQCALAVLLVKACEFLGYVKPQPFKRDLVKVWFPVNLIFVAMVGSSFYALQHVGVAMVTVWKNLSNVVTAACDVLIYGKRYSAAVWLTLALMLVSAAVGAYTDLSFTWSGYGWQIVNCGTTSAYALYLRSVMDRVAEHTTDRRRMDEFSMVLYNNALSIPPIMVLMLIFGEHKGLLSQPALSNPAFAAVAVLGGLIGFGISFSALWFLSQTTATIYSLVGALNKIPVAVVGIVIFHEASSPQNLASIFIGLGAGILFVYAKARGR